MSITRYSGYKNINELDNTTGIYKLKTKMFPCTTQVNINLIADFVYRLSYITLDTLL